AFCHTVDQSMVTVVCPVVRSVPLDAIRDKVAMLDNPAIEEMRASLDTAGTIHFTSLAVAGTGEIEDASGVEKGALVLEISGDGSASEVIDAVSQAIGHRLRPIFKD
ncbi:hypothetical protein EN853_33445, partial [Mesorhizobium sp. M1C.F.Ca.ET.210.01.1.1]|uniref:hypothetical protein n=1 Tax=Mesorhizobium sp. M1C.F.Ca.ET.210.01.1.1 TaxID=2563930 RepID=UPI001092B6A4